MALSGRIRSALMLCLSSAVFSGCTLGPDFMRGSFFSKDDTQTQYLNAPKTAIESPQSMAHWWKRLNDPLMQSYVDQLLSQNLELTAAAERVNQARANYRIAGADYYPALSGSADASRSFSPGLTKRQYTNSYGTDLSASWEIDLFGRIARSREAAAARFEASQYDREALQQSLIAELFNRRVGVAVNSTLLDFARKTVRNRENFYALVKSRYDLGSASVNATDVYLARQNLTNAKADIGQYERGLTEQSTALDILLGLKPGTTNARAEAFNLIPPPRDVALCLPAALLDRRPDLRASELRAKAANAEIGVAIADLYPSVSLGGTLGFSGASTNDLFTAENLAGSLLASITQRIFAGGALRANIDLQESQARELAATYSQNVLSAIRDVEVALNAEEALASELANTEKSLRDLNRAKSIARDRFERGLTNLQDYLDIEQSAYSAQRSLLLKKQEKWNARIALYLSLGGDWLGQNGADTQICNAKKAEL